MCNDAGQEFEKYQPVIVPQLHSVFPRMEWKNLRTSSWGQEDITRRYPSPSDVVFCRLPAWMAKVLTIFGHGYFPLTSINNILSINNINYYNPISESMWNPRTGSADGAA